jgi:hypothetical protein
MGGAATRSKVARVTVTETPVEVVPSTVWEPELGNEHPHIECCRAPRFYCGAGYHPELSAGDEHERDDLCTDCVKILEESQCWRGHQHCPIPSPFLGGFVCPDA